MSFLLDRSEQGWRGFLRTSWQRQPQASEEVRTASSMHGWLLVVMMTVTLTLYRFRHQWPLYLLIPLGSYILLAALIPRLRHTAPRVEIGRLGKSDLTVTTAVILFCTALFVLLCEVYHLSFAGFAAQVPRWNSALVVGICVAGCFINSCLEELIWRGVVYGAFAARYGVGVAIFLQALGFAFEHMYFLPVRYLGMAMAFVLGILLGGLRRRTGGIGAAVLAHNAVDLALISMILTYWF